MVVGPRGLVRGRWYAAGAIALALTAYGGGDSSAAVRRRTSPSLLIGGSARERWVTLVRWIDAARAGGLFEVAGGLGELTRRRAAEQVALALAARAGRDLGANLAEAAFAGAAIAA